LESEDAEASAAWSKEIRRRVDEVEAGTAELEDWETVRARALGGAAETSKAVSPCSRFMDLPDATGQDHLSGRPDPSNLSAPWFGEAAGNSHIVSAASRALLRRAGGTAFMTLLYRHRVGRESSLTRLVQAHQALLNGRLDLAVALNRLRQLTGSEQL